jgi:hypothetical protein
MIGSSIAQTRILSISILGLLLLIFAAIPNMPIAEVDADAKDIFVRFQPPKSNEHTEGARVSRTQWHTTDGEVLKTYKDYFNTHGNNAMLWMRLDIWALQYAGLYSHKDIKHVAPQLGLNKDNVAGKNINSQAR